MILYLTVTLLIACAQLSAGQFDVYWNSKSIRCDDKFGISFNLGQYGLIYNTGGVYKGDKVNYMERPGMFPEIDKKTGAFINGGVPQSGSIANHTSKFIDDLASQGIIATEGPLVFEFSQYRPDYNTANPRYRDESMRLVRELFPSFTTAEVKAEAVRQFNEDSEDFFDTLLTLGKALRPNALVGYHKYPPCDNSVAPCDQCHHQFTAMNDRISWLYANSDALYPSLTTKESGDYATYMTNRLSTKMKEANRINYLNKPIIPYIRYRYVDSKALIEEDVMIRTLWIVKYYGGAGTVVWADWTDYKTRSHCEEFDTYLANTLGPLLQCFSDMPNDIADVLRCRYPLYSNEAGQFDCSNLSSSAEAIVDQLETQCGVNTSSSDTIMVVATIIAEYCSNP